VFRTYLGKASAGQDLSQEEMADAVDTIMRGECSAPEIALLLTALHHKGETVAEVAGAATALRRHMTPIRTSRTGVIDTCGTGGDGSGTFNISTAAALVTAAAGVPVAKHGNRRITSRSGSADVLALLGVNIEADVAKVEACLEELGICFCFAPLLHTAMKNVSAVRQQLPFPTIFNLLGPLTNPAGAAFQLLGVGRPVLRPLLAEALALLGTQRALVVCGEDGLDEVTISGSTLVSETTAGKVHEFRWSPADFDLPTSGLDALNAAGPEESAAHIRQVLAGEQGAPRDIVVLNAAAALWTAGKAPTPAECARLASDAIDQGAARELLARLAQLSNA
jgi:anthranilate phosphoribosyltransferase